MELGLGKCKEHDRPYEGLCKGCEEIVCPSCVLFGNHKKHDIVSFREGAMYLRKAIDNRMYKGYFKKEFTENKIMEVKQAELLLEKSRSETMKKIEDTFKGIAHALKNRKAEVINELIDKFALEKEKIDNAEADWECKQEICEKLNQFDKDENSGFLLLNSKFILEGIRKISEPTQFNELSVYTNFDSSFYVEKENMRNGGEEEDGTEGNKDFNMDTFPSAYEAYKNTERGDEDDKDRKKEYPLDDFTRALESYASLLEPKSHNYAA